MKRAQWKRLIVFAVCLAAVLGVAVWIAWGNTALELNTYTVLAEELPEAFDGYRITHISDLHNAQIGDNNEKLLETIRKAEPDIIAITGDLIDSRNTNIEIALHFAEEAMKIAPCYYVTGNHEARIPECDDLKSGLTDLGVVVLEDERLEIQRSGEKFAVIGVNDPSFETNYLFGDAAAVLRLKLQEYKNEDTYTVLLSHRPELLETYAQCGVDLVLSGHAHGGQVRIPFVGGLVAPNQGLFPKYDAGMFIKENTTMIVSRGIGNSIIPIRVNNRPEVILIELSK